MVPVAGDAVVLVGHGCLGGVRSITLDTQAAVNSISTEVDGACAPSLVVAATGTLAVATRFRALADSFVFLDGGSIAAATLSFVGARLGGAGRLNGTALASESLVVPGVSKVFVAGTSCCLEDWPSYLLVAKNGDLVFSDLTVFDSTALIGAANLSYSPRVPSTATLSSIYATKLTVTANVSFFLNMRAAGTFLRWETLLLYGSVVKSSPDKGLPLLDPCSCGGDNVCAQLGGTSAVGSLCSSSLGVLTLSDDLCEAVCSCLPGETCLEVTRLCQRSLPSSFGPGIGSNSTTLPHSSGGGVETW